MVDSIDPFTTTTSNDANAIDTPPPEDAAPQIDPNRPPETPAEPENETDDEWARRFIEENLHLMAPPLVRPPAPPPQPWDGPRSQWKVPDHLSMPHPNGGYMAMALMSRTMDDLDEVTGGKRAATYEEVDTYFGHALIAEGLVPFTYTADEAIRWWKAGGYRVLGGQPIVGQSPQAAMATDDRTAATPPNASSNFGTERQANHNVVLAASTSEPSQLAASGATPERIEPEVIVTADPQRVADTRSLTDAEFAQRAEMEQWLGSLSERPAKDEGGNELGLLSSKYETGGRGPGTISPGKDDRGGKSYGSYQIASGVGMLDTFLASREFSPWTAEFSGLAPTSSAFDKQWRAVAARDREAFHKAQHVFIERTHYKPAVNAIRKEWKLDLSTRSEAVRNATWSVAVQHKKATFILSQAVSDTDRAMARTDPSYDQALIDNIYDRRTAYVIAQRNNLIARAAKLPNVPAPAIIKARKDLLGQAKQLTDVVKNRYPSERAAAQQMLMNEKKAGQ